MIKGLGTFSRNTSLGLLLSESEARMVTSGNIYVSCVITVLLACCLLLVHEEKNVNICSSRNACKKEAILQVFFTFFFNFITVTLQAEAKTGKCQVRVSSLFMILKDN